MATRSMFTNQSPRHMARNFEAKTRQNIMDCEHNVNLERSVFRRFDSQNNQNPYHWRSPVRPQPSQTNEHTLEWRSPVKPQPSQTNDRTLEWRSPVKPQPSQTNDHTLKWRSPVKPQPSQTNDRPSVFDRLGPNLQNTYTWRKPGSEQSTLPERKTPSRDQIGSSQALLEDIPKGINPVEVCTKAPHPTASGSGIRSKSSITQSYYQAPHPTASGSGDQSNSAIAQSCYQLNKKADSCHDDRGRYSQVNGDSRSCQISTNNSVSDRRQFNKISPMNRPVPGPSHQAQARTDDQFEKRVFKCLNLFIEKPWSKEDIEFIRRILSYESTPAPPEPSLEGLPPGTQVVVEPIRWRSDNPVVVPSLPSSSQNTQCEQTHSGGVNIFHINKKIKPFCTDGKRFKNRRAPFCLSEMGTASKQTKLDSRKICRKRKATEADCLDTINMAPPVKRPRFI